MRSDILVIVIAVIVSFFVTDVMACEQDPSTLGRICLGGGDKGQFSDPTFGPNFAPVPSPNSPVIDGELLEPQASSPSEPPSAQHLKLVAEAQARAKESARQWWINFFNNK